MWKVPLCQGRSSNLQKKPITLKVTWQGDHFTRNFVEQLEKALSLRVREKTARSSWPMSSSLSGAPWYHRCSLHGRHFPLLHGLWSTRKPTSSTSKWQLWSGPLENDKNPCLTFLPKSNATKRARKQLNGTLMKLRDTWWMVWSTLMATMRRHGLNIMLWHHVAAFHRWCISKKWFSQRLTQEKPILPKSLLSKIPGLDWQIWGSIFSEKRTLQWLNDPPPPSGE